MSESLLVKWQKRFVNGDQYTFIDPTTGKIQNMERNYYFEQRKVFNILLPVVKRWLENYPDGNRKIWGKNGLVAQLIPYQESYNDIKNKISLLTEYMVHPNLYVEDGSIDVDEISEDGLAPGKIIVYRQGSDCPSLEYKNYKENIEVLIILEEKCKKEFDDMVKILEYNILSPTFTTFNNTLIA